MASHITGEVHAPSTQVVPHSHVPSMEEYQRMYQRSVEEPAQFWSEVASEFYWQQKWQEGSELKCNFDVNKGKICVEWFKGAVTNICYNCLDKHVKNGRGDVVAFYWCVSSTGDSA